MISVKLCHGGSSPAARGGRGPSRRTTFRTTSPSRRSSNPKDSGCACWSACRSSRCATSTGRCGRRRHARPRPAQHSICDDADALGRRRRRRCTKDETAAAGPRIARRSRRAGRRSVVRNYDSALARVTDAAQPAERMSSQPDRLPRRPRSSIPIQSAASRFSIDPQWARLGVRTITVLRLLLPDGAVRAFEYPGNPGLVRLDPRWYQAAGASCSSASRTSSTARTICCSCSAW